MRIMCISWPWLTSYLTNDNVLNILKKYIPTRCTTAIISTTCCVVKPNTHFMIVYKVFESNFKDNLTVEIVHVLTKNFVYAIASASQ